MSTKDFIKKICIDAYYALYTVKRTITGPTVDVMSVDETISELINTEKSLVRFGDGELLMIRGGDIHFQKVDDKLSSELADIIKFQHDGLMVSVQDIFQGLSMYVPKSRKFWKEHLFFYNSYYKELCNTERIYASTSFSRGYITIADKNQSGIWFENIKKIWEGKDVVVVEGATTHNGVGNDLLNSAKSVKRIICPSKNAYARIDEIRNECFNMPKESLFLISLGPAAKPLVRDLYLEGFRAIDIGQLDSEYEMYLAGAREKIEISKHKVLSEEDNRGAGYEKYLAEIVERIE